MESREIFRMMLSKDFPAYSAFPLDCPRVSLAIGGPSAGLMVQGFPDSGRMMQAIVGSNFGGDIEKWEYAICILPGHGFCREPLFVG